MARPTLFGVTLLSYFASQGWALTARAPKGGAAHSLSFSHGSVTFEHTILTGSSPHFLQPIEAKLQKRGEIKDETGDGGATWSNLYNDTVQVHASYPALGYVGASFSFDVDDIFYGVHEYPFNGSISNNLSYADIGIYGDQPGVNWANARAPFFFSKSGLGVYVNSTALGTFDFSVPGQASFSFNTSELDYFVIYETNLTSLLTRFGNLSSTIEMPPDNAYGPIFWSDDFEQDFHGNVSNAQENYYDVVDHLYYNEIRATGLFADRPYGTGNSSFGNFDFDPEFYPTPEKFIKNLTEYGFDFQVWVANRAFLDTELYNTSKKNDWLFSDVDPEQFLGPALNLSIPEAYDFFLEKLTNFSKVGVKGFKIDRGEELEMPDAEQNEQMVLFEDLCYKAMEKVWGKGNFYNFARSVFDRSRSKTAVWNGDSQANFTGLQYSVASSIRAGLLGFSQWGSDTGGYLRTNDTPSEELWARWMHFSTFSPMYELMLGTNHTPWYDYTPRLVKVLKATADLHTQLIPYIKSYTYQATQTGLPVIRALFLEYPTDDSVYETADEYAFGKEFLVAPIITEGGSRSVYFPKGSGKFLEYYNKTDVFSGGDTHNVTDLALEYSPVYVREGAIIPTGDLYQGNAKWEKKWKPSLNIEVYPSFNVSVSTFEYYGSNGTNSTATITVTTDKPKGGLTITYDDLGLDAAALVYTKGGMKKVDLPQGGNGTEAKLKAFESLFA